MRERRSAAKRPGIGLRIASQPDRLGGRIRSRLDG